MMNKCWFFKWTLETNYQPKKLHKYFNIGLIYKLIYYQNVQVSSGDYLGGEG